MAQQLPIAESRGESRVGGACTHQTRAKLAEARRRCLASLRGLAGGSPAFRALPLSASVAQVLADLHFT